MPKQEAIILKEFSRVIKATGDGNWAESQEKLKPMLDEMHAIMAGKGYGEEREMSQALLDTIQIMYNVCSRKVIEEKSDS